MINVKDAVAQAVKKSQATTRREVSFASQVEEALDDILAAREAGTPMKDMAAEAGVPFARFSEAVTRALRKRQGLTITGKARKQRGGPRLLVSTRAAELAAAEGAPTRSPMPVSQPTVSPGPEAGTPPVPIVRSPGKVLLTPAAREARARKGLSASGLDQDVIEQAKREKAAIEEGRRSEIEIGGFKK